MSWSCHMHGTLSRCFPENSTQKHESTRTCDAIYVFNTRGYWLGSISTKPNQSQIFIAQMPQTILKQISIPTQSIVFEVKYRLHDGVFLVPVLCTHKYREHRTVGQKSGSYSETLNNEYIGRIYQMSSWQFCTLMLGWIRIWTTAVWTIDHLNILIVWTLFIPTI